MTGEESVKWLEEHFQPYDDNTKQSQAVRIAIKSLEAWEMVLSEIKESKRVGDKPICVHYAYGNCISIIEKYLSEVENEHDNRTN